MTSYPMFPEIDTLPAHVFPQPQSHPAKTPRQKEVEAKTGLTLQWKSKVSKTVWAEPGVYDPIAEEVDAMLAAHIREGERYYANYIVTFASADAGKDATALSQNAKDMGGIDQILNFLGLPLTFATRTISAYATSGGATPNLQTKAGYYIEKPQPAGYEYRTTINLRWLPLSRQAMLDLDFKSLGPLLDRNGAPMGVCVGDGSVQPDYHRLTLCHDSDDIDAVRRYFGEPFKIVEKGRGVVESFWFRTRREVAIKMLGDPGNDIGIINKRKLDAINRLIDG